MSIRVAIIDDHPLAVAGLVTLLKDIPDIEVTQTFSNAGTLFEYLKTSLPDVLLLDIKLPEVDGEAIAERISKEYPNIKMIAITSFDAPTYIKMMMKAGCKGYLLKSTDIDYLVIAIKEVYEGREYIEPELQKQIVNNLLSFKREDKKIPSITQREREVLELIISEHTNQEIAQKLFLSLRTVERHRENLLQKLGAKNTAGIVKNAIELGLLSSIRKNL